MLSSSELRQDRIRTIKNSLRQIAVISKNSLKVEAKEEKNRHRRQSLQLADIFQSEKLLRKFSDEDEQEQRSTINTFNEKYGLLGKVGEGANAVVHTCEYRETRKIYAVKIITMDEEHILELKKNFLSIKHLRHPAIIKYHALYFDLHKHVAYLIMEYFPFPNLLEIALPDEQELKTIFGAIFQAVNYIHERNVCHRDIKPENILYDPLQKRIKIIDFGISKKTYQRGARRDMLTIIGTSLYLAPEILLGGGYDERVDIWSVGVTLYRLVAGRTPFESEYLSDTANNIIKGKVNFDLVWNNYSFFLKDFVMRLLKPRDQRLSGKEAAKHFWLSIQGSPQGKMRRGSQNEEVKFPRHETFNLRVFKAFHEEQVCNLKHAISREEGEQQPSPTSSGKRKIAAKRINLIDNPQFDLSDSSDGESSPSTVHSKENVR